MLSTTCGKKDERKGGEDLLGEHISGSSGGALSLVIGALKVVVLLLLILVLGQRLFFGPSAEKESPQNKHQSKPEAPTAPRRPR